MIKSQGDVDGASRCKQFHRYQALVVVVGNHSIELAAYGASQAPYQREAALQS